jgi:D-xylose reductase
MQDAIRLCSGAELPSVGFGLWKVDRATAGETTKQAIGVGYRHLDCACDYGNEAEVGRGIAAAVAEGLCKRDDLWVTSKLWNTYHAPEHVRLACERSLQDLGLQQLDLYLIHFPIAQKFVPFDVRYPPGWHFDPAAPKPHMEFARVPVSETWKAMEQLVDDGLVKHIGICNFGTSLLRDLLSYARIRPAVLQIESHPYLTQDKLLRLCRDEQIAVTAFSPLGPASYYSLGMASPADSLLDNPVIQCIAMERSRTPAQVLLRWGIQRGTAVIPKSSGIEHMRENLDVFDFELTEADMQTISGFNQNRRFNDPGVFCESAFGTFCPIYE